MRLSEFGSLQAQLQGLNVFQDDIWQRPIETVTSFQLTLFHARMASLGLSRQAQEALACLREEAERADPNLAYPALHGRVIQPRFMADELVDGLKRLTSARAQATLYALEEDLEPVSLVEMTWRDVLATIPKSAMSTEILRTRNACRHIKLPYVFWEFASERIAAPMIEFEPSVRRAFRMDWSELKLAYKSMAMIDRRGDAEDLKLLLGL